MDGPGPAAVKASVDEGRDVVEGAIVLRGWCTSPVVGVRDRSRPLTNSRNVSDHGARWVEHHDSHLILGEELAQGPAVGVAVLIELHPLQKKCSYLQAPLRD